MPLLYYPTGMGKHDLDCILQFQLGGSRLRPLICSLVRMGSVNPAASNMYVVSMIGEAYFDVLTKVQKTAALV